MKDSYLPEKRRERSGLLLAVLTIALLIGGFGFLSRAQEAKNAPAKTAEMASNADKSPEEAKLRAKLTPLQYHVTRENGTEPPFQNAYNNNHSAGIYVDVINGEPLFSSLDKFESGTGWPSFTKPVDPTHVVEKTEKSLFSRTEVRSKSSDSHLGHVFEDGPQPTGLRYCMNSAALRFVPVEKLKQEGLGQYLPLFENRK